MQIYYPTVKVVPNAGNRLRENTFVRMRYRVPPSCRQHSLSHAVCRSLVDVRSSPANILDHFHHIVDCRNSPLPQWKIEKAMGSDGRAVFNDLGLVKSLEAEKVKVVAERIICRREEDGDSYARGNKWERTQITNKAEQQCRAVEYYEMF